MQIREELNLAAAVKTLVVEKEQHAALKERAAVLIAVVATRKLRLAVPVSLGRAAAEKRKGAAKDVLRKLLLAVANRLKTVAKTAQSAVRKGRAAAKKDHAAVKARMKLRVAARLVPAAAKKELVHAQMTSAPVKSVPLRLSTAREQRC